MNNLERSLDLGEDQQELANAVETSKKYLTFCSDDIRFAIASDYVIEIINEHSVTHLPKVPDFIEGIINLRGQIIPIMDVRLRMGHPKVEMGRESCIIVVSVNETMVGLLVDKVLQMIDIETNRITPPPASHRQDYVNGIARINNEVCLILDCGTLLMG